MALGETSGSGGALLQGLLGTGIAVRCLHPAFFDSQDGEKLDKEALMREAITGQMKERQELERKMQSQARRADHLERARREEEAPLLLAAYNTRLQVVSSFDRALVFSNDKASNSQQARREEETSFLIFA